MSHAMMPSPLGEMMAVFDAEALLGLYFVGQKYPPSPAAIGPRDEAHPIARATAAHLVAYFDGEPAEFDGPIRFVGTPFQVAVWTALRAIARGHTVSYGELARRVGAVTAVRAVGAAVGRNPLSLIVPCHRVVGGDGSLTGYAGGLPRKVRLLQIEGVLGEADRRVGRRDPDGPQRPLYFGDGA
jgi:methylated-DNA-[protein]-cysteine S-methyltransferase